MIVRDLLLAVLTCQIRFAYPYLIDGITKNNLDFVEIIKQDLRRNNDDYKEMANKKIEYSRNKLSTVLNNKYETGTVNSRRDFRRNDAQMNQEYDYDETIQPFTKSTTIKKLHNNYTTLSPLTTKMKSRINLVNINRNHSEFGNLNIKTASKQSLKNLNSKGLREIEVPKFVNRNKINKFKQFMKKNEERLRNYVSSKQQATTLAPKLLEPSKVVTHFMPNILKQGVIGRVRKDQEPQDDNGDALPNPELLDMAPAKGGSIHKKRIKGRLCHRHVLIPEGPKYDSRGRWYLPAHELVARRPYDVTRRPRLLLPRCCNCCKKSLLGCE